ncbi:MAG TPA: Bax inhibitor-1/YccA family protein [Nocardioidaceae bacterium]|nr:Bax inhibitor-1/YccA family protein [Nocardioidaceae bacterium]
MQSSNPVFARSEGFNGRQTSQSGVTYPAYGESSSWGTGSPQTHETYAPARPSAPMTLDSVVQKTGVTLGLLVLSAALTWILTGSPADAESARTLSMLWMGGAFAGLGLALVISFKRSISPGLVLVYAVVEGVFVGAMSKYFQAAFGEGVVSGAVLGTVVAFASTLAAYKFFNIQVSSKFRKWVVAAMFGFVAITLLDFVLHFFGAAIGFNGFGTLGLIMSFVGLGLGVLMLILDFDFVERGIAAGLPEVESWRAAFGLTVTIIWIYIEILRILAIFRGD